MAHSLAILEFPIPRYLTLFGGRGNVFFCGTKRQTTPLYCGRYLLFNGSLCFNFRSNVSQHSTTTGSIRSTPGRIKRTEKSRHIRASHAKMGFHCCSRWGIVILLQRVLEHSHRNGWFHLFVRSDTINGGFEALFCEIFINLFSW